MMPLSHFLENCDPEAFGCICAANPKFRGPVYSYRRRACDLRASYVMDRIEKIVQSDDEVNLEETTFTITFGRTQKVGARSTGLQRRLGASLKNALKNKQAFIDPLAKWCNVPSAFKNMCLPLSILTGKKFFQLGCHFHKKGQNSRCFKKLHKYLQSKDIKLDAEELVINAGLSGYGPFSVDEVAKFQRVLGNDYQICIYDSEIPPPAYIFGSSDCKFHINLFMEDQHIVFVASMTAMTGQNNFCELCKITCGPFHRCSEAKCKLCRDVLCSNTQEASLNPPPRCHICNFSFKTDECYQTHKIEKCEKRRLCLKCYQSCQITEYPNHLCGRPECKTCGARHLPMLPCYVQPDSGKESRRVYYADMETFVDQAGNHTPNLIVVFDENAQEFMPPFCGLQAIQCFVETLTMPDSPFKDSFIFFHNGSGFDSHFVHAELVRLRMTPAMLCRGQKIITLDMKQNNIGFRDTLQFVPGTSLSAFPKTFELESGPKGHFPHKINGPKWVDFDDLDKPFFEDGARFPGEHYFHPENMRPAERESFERWHAEVRAEFAADPDRLYYPAKELLHYCRQDVRILAQGFQKYRQQWLHQFPDMDPVERITFPQFNNAILRNKYMIKDSLALLPPQGFNQTQSLECFAWLDCKKAELKAAGLEIQEERNGRKGFEVRLAGLKVDGYFKDSSGQQHVLQYHGCFYHGCQKCKLDKKHWQKVRFMETLEESQRLRDLSTDPDSPYGPFIYHEIWGHDFAKWEKDPKHPHYQRIKDFRMTWSEEPLKPRQAMFGGRTNVIQDYVQVEQGQRLAYLDFTSLYPAVMYGTDDQEFPVGSPKIYIGLEVIEDAPKLQDAFGLWKVKVYPPKTLLHPVLPISINGKLMFPLCWKCANLGTLDISGNLDTSTSGNLDTSTSGNLDISSSGNLDISDRTSGDTADFGHLAICQHSEEERAWTGTYFTGELQMAVQKGYQLGTPLEVWDWPEDQRSCELFRPMIRDQYKKKVTASKFQSEEEVQDAIKELQEMNIEVDRQDFKPNPSLRALAKFSMNNIWGYLGMRQDQVTTEYVDYKELNSICADSKKELLGAVVKSPDYALVHWKSKEEKPFKKGSIVHALITTAHARLKLYNVIDSFSEYVVYFDTDSVFLLLPDGVKGPKTSNRLGELKDEVDKGHRITCFYSLGPKTYTYKEVDQDGNLCNIVLKTKGISLTSAATKVVNSETIKTLVENKHAEVKVPQWQIARDMANCRVFNTTMDKRLAYSANKRRPIPGSLTGATLPFGYVPE